MISRTGCWTCKNRKVSCDRALPTCLRCSKSRRCCEGYGLRLSWPQPDDGKRTIVAAQPLRRGFNVKQQQIRQWINAFESDVRLHHVASILGTQDLYDRDSFKRLAMPDIPEAIEWTSSKFNPSDGVLLQYFEAVVSNVLAMLDSDRTRIRETLMRMALSDRGPSSKAVLHAILALASVHRDGHQPHAARLKLEALQALIESSKQGLCAATGIEHIAVGMLLCVFETHARSQRTPHWLGHICGAKDVIYAVQRESHNPGSDCAVILGWVYYYDLLARFSIRHWRTHLVTHTVTELGFHTHGSSSCALQYVIARASFAKQIPNISRACHPVLRLLFEVFETVLYPWGPEYHSDGYREYLTELESRLTGEISLAGPDIGSSPSVVIESVAQILHLFRLAALVYLERTSKNFSGQSSKLDRWTGEAFAILNKLDTCPYPFVLFIFGNEACTDDLRLAVLELIAKTEQGTFGRDMQDTKELIQSAWIQDDLEVDGDVEYIRKLNLVLSARDIIPSFM